MNNTHTLPNFSKQYELHFSVNMLMVISESLCLVLDYNGEDQSLALNISKAFDRLWHVCLLYKLNRYGPSNRISNLIQSLSYPKINIVLNGLFLDILTSSRACIYVDDAISYPFMTISMKSNRL